MDKIKSSSDTYTLLEFLGSGSFAKVWHAKCDRNEQDVAIKIVDVFKLSSRIRINEEIRIQSALNHSSIVKLYQHFEDTKNVFLVMEFCQGGTLQEYLRSTGGQLTENEARPLFKQIVEGVHYLHSCGIIHRDLSLSNILLTNNTTVKISDFGLAKQLNHKDEKYSTMCGTPNFISPEVVTQRPHGLEADMFSLGCILYTLLVGKPPFDTKALESTLNKVRRVDFSMPDFLSPHAKSLISSLLKKNPRDRISLEGVLRHQFLSKDRTRLKNRQIFEGLQDSGLGSTATTLSSNGDCSYARYSTTHGQCEGQLSVIFSERSYNTCRSAPVSAYSVKERPYENELASCVSQCRLDDQESCLSKHALERRPTTTNSYIKSIQETGMQYSHEPSFPDQVQSRTLRSSCSQHASASALETERSLQKSVCSHAGVSCSSHCSHAALCRCHLHPPVAQAQQMSRGPGFSEASYQHTKAGLSSLETRKRWSPAVESLADMTPPLSTVRLKPTKQRTKNALVTITDSGEIVMEFFKRSGHQEKLKNVCTVSSDGMKIHIQKPGSGKMIGGEEMVFSYQSLPKEHWAKYEYAARFLGLVQAKTPKVTFYSELAKCILMENKTDFEAEFYKGEKISLISSLVKVVTLSGHTYSMKFEENLFDLDSFLKYLLEHFRNCHQHCVNIESVLSLVESKTGKACFPVIIGRRPSSALPMLKSSNKENTLTR